MIVGLVLMMTYPFQNPGLPVEDRITNLLSLMTLEEKVECLDTNPSVPRLGIEASGHVEGLHGLAQAGPANWTPRRKVPTTMFPQAYGLGQTWDADLIQQVARVEGIECRYIWQSPKYKQGGIVVRAPNADLGRDPRWGRTEECYGEDPFLTGKLTQAFVKGLQGDHPKFWLTASLMKHFLANSHEDDREKTSSDFDERLWREYYSVPFRMGVEAGSRAYMAAYNAHNGIPMHIHPDLKSITVDEWGQDGIICTDGGGYMLLRTAHKAVKTEAEAAAAIVKAGIGQFLDRYRDGVNKALAQGLLTEAEIDTVLRGNFRVMAKLGILDPTEGNPYAKIGEGPEPWLSDENKKLVRLVTQKSIVLLKNEAGTLPLNPKRIKRVAVVGNRADKVYIDWYSGGPTYTVTPLDGIRAALPNAEVRFATTSEDAVAIARDADVVIAVVGNDPVGEMGWAKVERPSDGKEAKDRESIDLEDEELIRQVHAVNPKTVVVLTASFPYAINWCEENVPAILQMSHNSQEQGSALADVLLGRANPAGRLTQTWVKSLADLPPMLDYDLRKGRTYLYFRGEPLYPFGYGLSYTRFRYSKLEVAADDRRITVSFDLKNTGRRDGEEVPQLYVRHLDSKVVRPLRELRAFSRVSLAKGETKRVTFEVPLSELAYWSVEAHRWVVEKGRVELIVGASSVDDRLRKTVKVKP